MFFAFCAAASGIYLINDLSDLSSDRRHPRKRYRPLASGALPILGGAALAPTLLAVGVALGTAAGGLSVILTYIALSLGYSLKLKEMPLVDVFILAALYTIRLVGGGIATEHVLTLWLLAFSGFVFLSLALVKRVEELQVIHDRLPGLSALRRGYYASDLVILQSFGCRVLLLLHRPRALRPRSGCYPACRLSLPVGNRSVAVVLAMPAVALYNARLYA